MLTNIRMILFTAFLTFTGLYYFTDTFIDMKSKEVSYTALIDQANKKVIKDVIVDDGMVISNNGSSRQITYISKTDNAQLLDIFNKNGVTVSFGKKESGFSGALYSIAIMVLSSFIFFFIFQRMQQSRGGLHSSRFGEIKDSTLVDKEDNKVSWSDIKGIDEAKEELKEIADYLKDQEKYEKMGAKIPKGILLVGSPGCGKTLMSKAMASSVGANFYSLSGSDFMEMLVGVGASRVRDLFNKARENAPSIIFIDEIDTIGKQRGKNAYGGDEREQTLNALLVEMDGFKDNAGVIVIAATNMPEILDKALLRPGRFDRQVVVNPPDTNGREEIFTHYLKGIQVDSSLDAKSLAKKTYGFTGADINNMVNEAALLAVKMGKDKVNMDILELAKEKITIGLKRKTVVMDEEEKKATAYHEAGHAIVALALKSSDEVHKVSIAPRGKALGVTAFMQNKDIYTYDKNKIMERIAVLLAGRLSEKLFLNIISTGASDDIQRATHLARDMVSNYGMTSLGLVNFSGSSENPFIWSENTKLAVDQEVIQLIGDCEALANRVLNACQQEIHKMVNLLMEKECINEDECLNIIGSKHKEYSCEI